tara:strand:+ start:19142 stop:19366 length:225 start_codon:yes stop_codon:yes gene_type:complete
MTSPITYASNARAGLDHETGQTMLVLTDGNGEPITATLLSPAEADELAGIIKDSARTGQSIQSAGMAGENGGTA